MRTALTLAALVLSGGALFASEPCLSAKSLLRSTQCELESLYTRSEMGTAPTGTTRGTAIFSPGTHKTVPVSRMIRVLWRGKEFPDCETMINRVLWGKAITAKVYVGESWYDGKPSMIFDYAPTSKLFGNARDEVREIAPGLWLGLTYVRKDCRVELTNFFVLEAKCQ